MNGNETAAKFQAEVGQVLDSGHCWNLLFVCVWKIFQAVGCQLFFLITRPAGEMPTPKHESKSHLQK